MKNIFCFIGYFLLAIGLAGCASLKPVTQPSKAISVSSFLPYSGQKAKIAVADFDVKASKVSTETVSALRLMLAASLVNSNRFSVVEGEAKAGDLIITATVTEFEAEGSGGRQGIGGGGGGGSGRLGGLLGVSLSKAHMALDIRIVDTSTSELLAASHVQGQALIMEKATQACILEAVRYIFKAVPESYYKY
jgi:curli biogenesis system outer membrane secretion channel CsgG